MIESLRLWLEELLQEMDDVGGRLTELDVALVYKYFPTHSITHCKIQVVKRAKRACNIIILNECMMGCFNYFAFFTFLSCFLITLFVDHEMNNTFILKDSFESYLICFSFKWQ